jgi:rubrerythrin
MSDTERLKAIADELDNAMKDFVAKAVPLFKEASEVLIALYGRLQKERGKDDAKRGKWINLDSDPKHLASVDICSKCGQIRRGYSSWHYCPNCGAKMDGVSDGTD